MTTTTHRELVMVDDNAGDLFLVERALKCSKLTWDWRCFVNGLSFMAHLRQVKDGHAAMPGLVLLDLNMPGMSGLEVLAAMRGDPFFKDAPICCVLTSSSDPRDRDRAAALGAHRFVLKTGDVSNYVSFFDAMA